MIWQWSEWRREKIDGRSGQCDRRERLEWAASGLARAITSDLFFQSLLSAPDAATMRSLVEERATLVAGVRQSVTTIHGGRTRPISRSPRAAEEAALDTKTFVRAIRGD